MHNITGGPRFLRDHADVVYAIILANIVQGFLLLFIGVFVIHFLSAIVKVPPRLLIPSVLVIAAFGAFGLTGTMAGPITLLVFALLGWLMRHYEYSVPAAVIGLILGSMAEGELLRSCQISGGDFSYVLGRPITLVAGALLIASLFLPPLLARLRLRMAGPAGATK